MILYNYTPEEIRVMVREDPLSARILILGMRDTCNLLSDLMDKMTDDSVPDMSVLGLRYRRIPFGVPCMNEHDAFVIINHPVQLVQWKARFVLKYGNLPLELVEQSDHRTRFVVKRNVPRGSVQYQDNKPYWEDHEEYLKRKYEAIRHFKS